MILISGLRRSLKTPEIKGSKKSQNSLSKDNKNVSCEVEGFVETHLRKLRGILRSRVLRVSCDLIKDVSPYIKFEGNKIWQLWNSVSVRTNTKYVAMDMCETLLIRAKRVSN